MLTFPAVRNLELSNIRIFNHGRPVHINSLGEFGDAKKVDKEKNVLNFTPKEFIHNMSTELNGLIRDVSDLEPKTTRKKMKKLLIQNNRLTYIGFLIIMSTVVLWVFYARD